MAQKKDKKREQKREGSGDVLQALALTTTIGMELAITVVLGYFGGRYLDQMFGTGPWLLLTGVLTGLAAGIVSVYKTLQGFLGE
ncbi:MAG: AtpZ/AtpI family protein [Desulfotomaculaceae bacterium]|nr:AtpZ/AtpI family protein [Desulfotomaculaceae bacterium]